MVHQLRLHIRYILVTAFVFYMLVCMYIVQLAQQSNQVQWTNLHHQYVSSNLSHRWHYDPAGHKRYHEEQHRKHCDAIFTNSTAKLLFQSWMKKVVPVRAKTGGLEIYGDTVVYFHNISVNSSLAFARAKGGENIQDVLNRKDSDEEYKVYPGYFSVPCRANSSSFGKIHLKGKAPHYKQWIPSLKCTVEQKSSAEIMNASMTIVIARYEYANVYWAMMDLYDTYLTLTFLNHTMSESQLLILDAHPYTPLDGLLSHLFLKVLRPKQLPTVSKFPNMAWTFPREFSPMLNKQALIPLTQEFRQAVLDGFKIKSPETVPCKKLNILFVWRRNYVAHPRNPEGNIARKISNEDDLILATTKAFPTYNITGVQLDALPMHDQVSLLARTNIFIGMHGAAFGFTMLLRPGSGVIEMFPQDYGHNWHMEFVARRSAHYYISWKNHNKSLEDLATKSTKVPPAVVIGLIDRIARNVCTGKPAPRLMVPTMRTHN